MDHLKNLGKKTFSSLSVRNYRLYFIGQFISLSGTWMQTVANGWLVLTISHSGTQVGIVAALEFVPMLIFGPWGGLLADRYNKKKLLYATSALAGFVTLLLGVLVLADMVQLWMLYIAALLGGLTRLVDNPARQSFVHELVGPELIKNAVSLNATVNNLSRAVGPSIGSILIAGIGIGFCFIFNALSFVAVMIALHLMRDSELHTTEVHPKRPGQIREGFRYVMETPAIRNTLIMMTLIGTFVYEFQVSLPILAKDTFLGDAASYSALMSAMGIGAVVGGLFSAGRHSVRNRDLVVFMFFLGVSLIATAYMPTLHLATIGMLFVGFFGINTTSLANSMIQLEAKPEMRGRVMAFLSMAMMGSTPIGGPIVGAIGEFMGGREALEVGAIAAFVAVAFGLVTHYKQRKAELLTDAEEMGRDEADAQEQKML